LAEEKKNSLATRKGMTDTKQHPASFRDPAGFIFEHAGKFYRQVNQVYAPHFELFKKSGLYETLASQKKILSHTELDSNFTATGDWYKTLLPEQLQVISYPYEWCFSQWKDAALLTLELVKTSMDHGMILKDATPFNIQFVNGAPVFIDTLSFEEYDASKPWIAYRQFIECFVGPLLLARHHLQAMLKLFQIYPDGIPLPVISKLLPFKAVFNFNVFLHIRLPQLMGSPQNTAAKKQPVFTRQKLTNIISNLHSFVLSLRLPPVTTTWNNYYEETILSTAYAEARMAIVESWLKETNAQTVTDLGTNTGLYAKAAAAAGKFTIAVDADTACIDKLYNECRQQNIHNLLPLCIDITNPSPAIGWNNEERPAFFQRVQADLVLALALVHHLAIGKNIGLQQIASAFSQLSPNLVVEFVPKNDPKVQLLLSARPDIFTQYNESFFEEAFKQYYMISKKTTVPGTERIMYLMKRK